MPLHNKGPRNGQRRVDVTSRQGEDECKTPGALSLHFHSERQKCEESRNKSVYEGSGPVMRLRIQTRTWFSSAKSSALIQDRTDTSENATALPGKQHKTGKGQVVPWVQVFIRIKPHQNPSHCSIFLIHRNYSTVRIHVKYAVQTKVEHPRDRSLNSEGLGQGIVHDPEAECGKLHISSLMTSQEHLL